MAAGLDDACVAFQGGGALGLAHLGAWQVLARRFRIIGTAGTSAGSIAAVFVASGYDPVHALDLFGSIEWPTFVKRQRWLDLFGRRDGWSDGEKFFHWMQQRLTAKLPGQPQHVSFESLYAATGVYLAVMATDLNDREARPVQFDVDTDPKVSVAFAVRASISIPGFMVAVPRRDRGQILVDGALLLNLPVSPLVPLAERKRCPLIGIRFEQPLSYLDNPDVREVLQRSLNTMTTPGSLPPREVAQDLNYIDIAVDASGFNSLNFALSPSEKDELIRRGARAAEKALLEYDMRRSATDTSEGDGDPGGFGAHLQRDIYVSRPWQQSSNPARQREAAFADGISQLLMADGFRLVGDAPDHADFSESRIEFIMSDCGGFAAILTDRGEGKPSSYMLREIRKAKALGIPCLIVAEPTVVLPDDLADMASSLVSLATSDLASNAPSVWQLQQKVDLLRDEWKMPQHPHYVFFASDFGKGHAHTNAIVKDTVERLTGMECVIGDKIQISPLQGAILQHIVGATAVIANLSVNEEENWNINTCIEAGIARGAQRELHLVCRTPRRSPPFMFRDMQVHFYDTPQDLVKIIRMVLAPLRRKVVAA